MSAESSAEIIRRLGEKDRLMPTWIPADFNDRPKGPVLVWDGCDMLVAVRLCPGWHEIATGKTIHGVTHWTVLPEPPKDAA